MIREHLFSKRTPTDPDFRWRGGEMSRLEALADGVFGLTITLLVVSASAPQTFTDLWLMVRDLPAFLVSFALIIMAWYYHYIYFRRYGLEDIMTIVLNSVFLFLVMFLAYPLKFLATFLWFLIIGEDVLSLFAVAPELENLTLFGQSLTESGALQRQAMMYFYSFGILGLFGTLAIMQARALSLKEKLELDALEVLYTKSSIAHHMLDVAIAAVSLLVLYMTGHAGWSGIVYFALPFGHFIIGWTFGAKIKAIHAQFDRD